MAKQRMPYPVRGRVHLGQVSSLAVGGNWSLQREPTHAQEEHRKAPAGNAARTPFAVR